MVSEKAVEVAARRMWEADDWDGMWEETKHHYRRSARAALEAALPVVLADFESLARWVTNCTGHGVNARQREQGERLLELITKEQK